MSDENRTAALPAEGEALSGVELIAAERRRQVEAEGWTPGHDDAHDSGELSDAAACYVMAAEKLRTGTKRPSKPFLWPWEPHWWKPGTDPVRCLVKAGALIAAEIDRLQRAAQGEPAPSPDDKQFGETLAAIVEHLPPTDIPTPDDFGLRESQAGASPEARRHAEPEDVVARLLDEFEAQYGTQGDIGLPEVRRFLETRPIHWRQQQRENGNG